MAIIKCVECGNDISSFAPACPVCGCPAEYQTKTNSDSSTHGSVIEVSSSLDIKNKGTWERAKEYILVGNLDAADRIIKGITGKNITENIILEIRKTREIPIDMIIQTYPDQVVDITKINNYEEWEKIFKKAKNGDRLGAQDDIMSLAKVKLWQAMEVVDEMKASSDFPVDFIIDKIPSQKAQPTTRPCKACNKIISVKAEKCPHCGEPTGVRVCPRCGSTDVVILDAVSKAVSMALFGPLSINTVRSKYECWTCHFKF